MKPFSLIILVALTSAMLDGCAAGGTHSARNGATAALAAQTKGSGTFFGSNPILASAEAPATQPASPALPSGHPDISKLEKQNASGALPSGHPDISKLEAEAAKTSGILIIEAIQSTPGGPKVSGDNFTVSFYSNDQFLDKLEGSLDDNGAASVGGIPFSLSAHAVVKVTHNGAEYQAQSKVVNAQSPQVTLEVPVYEKAPATTNPSVAPTTLPTAQSSRDSAEIVAASGAVFLVLFGIGFMLIKGSRR